MERRTIRSGWDEVRLHEYVRHDRGQAVTASGTAPNLRSLE